MGGCNQLYAFFDENVGALGGEGAMVAAMPT